ncbi:MAG: hypothetical protein ACREOH_04025, partial [Candidatus Entotheonellia bacterium]
MAIEATEIYCTHPEDFDGDLRAMVMNRNCPLRYGNFRLARTPEESKAINAIRGPMLIIAASGMATGGRVLHHLRRRLPDPRTTVLLVGYQAAGTRGRLLVQLGQADAAPADRETLPLDVERLIQLCRVQGGLRWTDQIIETARRHGIRLPKSMLALTKGLALIESLALELDPEVSLRQELEGVRQEVAVEGLKERLSIDLPELLESYDTLLQAQPRSACQSRGSIALAVSPRSKTPCGGRPGCSGPRSIRPPRRP